MRRVDEGQDEGRDEGRRRREHGGAAVIERGRVVDTHLYLEGLWLACAAEGAAWERQRVGSLRDLLAELRYAAPPGRHEGAATLLTALVCAAPSLIQPYGGEIMGALRPLLLDADAPVATDADGATAAADASAHVPQRRTHGVRGLDFNSRSTCFSLDATESLLQLSRQDPSSSAETTDAARRSVSAGKTSTTPASRGWQIP